jgi:hypothetical protein
VVGERKRKFGDEPLEAGAGDLEPDARFRTVVRRQRDVGKPPCNLGIAAFEHGRQQVSRPGEITVVEEDLRKMHASLDVARNVVEGSAIPQLGPPRVWRGNALAPERTELEADPARCKRRHVGIFAQRAKVRAVGLAKLTQIDQQRTQRHQLRPAPGLCRALAARRQDRRQVRSGGLIEGEHKALGIGRGRARFCRQRERAPGLRKAMRRSGNLSRDQRCSSGLRRRAGNLVGECL